MIKQIVSFYHDGFTSMRLGKTLWVVVIVKLAIIFFVLKLFLMPNILHERADGHEADYVSSQITGRIVDK